MITFRNVSREVTEVEREFYPRQQVFSEFEWHDAYIDNVPFEFRDRIRDFVQSLKINSIAFIKVGSYLMCLVNLDLRTLSEISSITFLNESMHYYPGLYSPIRWGGFIRVTTEVRAKIRSLTSSDLIFGIESLVGIYGKELDKFSQQFELKVTKKESDYIIYELNKKEDNKCAELPVC